MTNEAPLSPPNETPSTATPVAASDRMRQYFASLMEQCNREYAIASEARAKGLDPSLEVEIPVAEDLASRVEKLVGPPGIADAIRAKAELGNRELIAIMVAKDIAESMRDQPRDKALDQAIRTGLAIITEGVLVAPLEGIAEVRVGRNSDGTEYADIYFAGPIRSAGGTGQALSVLIGDVVRRPLGLDRYKPTPQEIERYKEEFGMYRNLQYRPSNEEIDLIVRECPVCVNGEGTERDEVTGGRDLPRVPTNQVRGGVCLVIAEGLCLKAAKIQKHVDSLEIEGWDFISRFLSKGKKGSGEKVNGEESGSGEKVATLLDSQYAFIDPPPNSIEPKTKFIKDLIAGRPVFGHPSRAGGFRLRFGRGRTTGLAATAVHPASMVISNDFMAIGTQIKVERPGKAGAITPVDSIEGPIVRLRNMDIVQLQTREDAMEKRPLVDLILDLGEILVPFGEFAENNHLMIPGSFSKEWWWKLLAGEIGEGAEPAEVLSLEDAFPSPARAFELSELHGLPLCPDYNLFFHDLPPSKLIALRDDIIRNGKMTFTPGRFDASLKSLSPDRKELLSPPLTSQVPLVPLRVEYDEELVLPFEEEAYSTLGLLGVTLVVRERMIRIDRYALSLTRCLGLDSQLHPVREPPAELLPATVTDGPMGPRVSFDVMRLVSQLAGVVVLPRSPVRIGARMGRPEKADRRMMKPPVHSLFPISDYGGDSRLLLKAAENSSSAGASMTMGNGRTRERMGRNDISRARRDKDVIGGTILVRVGDRICSNCGERYHLIRCPHCGGRTEPVSGDGPGGKANIVDWAMPIKEILDSAKAGLSMSSIRPVKAVKGMMSGDKLPEPLEKGILRAINDVYVFKDGTARFDMTDVTLTHVRPREIGTSVEKMISMGYTADIHDRPLTDPDQVLELKVQDIVVSKNCGDYLVNISRFIDDLLVKFYDMKPFYNASDRSDMVGVMAIGLAPHTSGGVLCRVIGYTSGAVGYGHPFFHAAKRRNCDGDEDAIMLLMDGLLNFSRKFIPDKRGGLMDAPLVMTVRLDPNEIDKEAQNVDTRWSYPLRFYEDARTFKGPKDVEGYMDLVASRIGTPAQYEGFGFTHDTRDIAEGPVVSAYKVLGSMKEKMLAQLELGRKLRGVDESDVASKVISNHFLPDMIGNLRSFSRQEVRCTACSAKYRRIPLRGVCTNTKAKKLNEDGICGHKLTMTVSEGAVKKYLILSKEVAERYHVDRYIYQRILQMERSINSIFNNDKVRKCRIDEFF